MTPPSERTDLRSTLQRSARGDGPGLRRGLWLSFLSPLGLEAVVDSGIDWVGVDLQHGELELSDVTGLLRVAEAARLPLLTRLPSHATEAVSRALDAGVDGVIVPLVESPEQAAALVSAFLTPPRGMRSTGTSRSSLGRHEGSSEPVLLPMIETAAGLACADDILAVPGVDGVFVGPYDLSASAGFPAPDSAPTIEALRRVVASARAAGKIVGFMGGRPALLAEASAADLVAVDTDVSALRAGVARLLDRP